MLPDAERILFTRIFTEKLDRDIPALLHDIWDTKVFTVQKLPVDKFDEYEFVSAKHALVIINRGQATEYADYLNLPPVDDCMKIIEAVETLAEGAAKSYAWNVRNAFIKGGRLRPAFDRLYLTDWNGAFKVNIVKNSEADAGDCPEGLIPGWIAYRYRFAAVKASNLN